MLEFSEVGVLDRNAEELGVPTSELMENAGKGLADFIVTKLITAQDTKSGPPEIIVFCGPGNNGGDGFVAARYLADHADVKIVLTAAPGTIRTELAKDNYDKISSVLPIHTKPSEDELRELLENTAIIIDCMLGVGLEGELRKPYATYIQVINEMSSVVVSADAPTGLGTTSSLKPDHTVTFHDIKIGMSQENSGNIVVLPIGIPRDAWRFIGPGELVTYYPQPSKSSHKGQNGRLLIIGGGPYIGAPALAGLAALRSGVDLVHIATPERSLNAIAGYSPNFIVHDLAVTEEDFIGPEDIYKVLELCTRTDACVLGPGLGREPQTLTFVKDLLARCPIPVILDADGLAALDSTGFGSSAADKETNKPKAGWLITPHFNEFSRIMEQIMNTGSIQPVFDASQSMELEQLCKNLSSTLGAVIVLKGSTDLVCDSERLKFNRTGNPGMTVGGTGDVLAGIIGALAAKNLDLYNCGRLGVFLNGRAGDLAWADMGPGLTATDIIEYIPSVLTEFITF